MPKRPSSGTFIFSGVLIALFVIAISMALGYHGRAKVAPLVVAIPGLLVTLVILAKDLRAKASPASADTGEGEKKSKVQVTTKSELTAFAWIGLLFILLYILGFAVAIPLYLFLYMKVKSNETLKFSVTFAAVSSVVLYVFFMQILKMQLYPGLIMDLMTG